MVSLLYLRDYNTHSNAIMTCKKMAALGVPSGASNKQKLAIQMAATADGKYFKKPRGRYVRLHAT